jgi:hypothetical protein
MKRITIILAACAATLVSAAAIDSAKAEGGTWHCYITVGGTPCAEDGTELAARYEADARRYAEAIGIVYAPIPGTAPTTLPPDYVEPEKECFVLAGGNLCYVVGSPDWERAVELAESYRKALETVPNNYVTTVPETTTTIVTDIGTPALAPDVTVVTEAPVETIESPEPVAPRGTTAQTLPLTS